MCCKFMNLVLRVCWTPIVVATLAFRVAADAIGSAFRRVSR